MARCHVAGSSIEALRQTHLADLELLRMTTSVVFLISELVIILMMIIISNGLGHACS